MLKCSLTPCKVAFFACSSKRPPTGMQDLLTYFPVGPGLEANAILQASHPHTSNPSCIRQVGDVSRQIPIERQTKLSPCPGIRPCPCFGDQTSMEIRLSFNTSEVNGRNSQERRPSLNSTFLNLTQQLYELHLYAPDSAAHVQTTRSHERKDKNIQKDSR